MSERTVKELGIELKIREVISEFTPKDSLKINSEREHQQKYGSPGKPRQVKQLSLWDLLESVDTRAMRVRIPRIHARGFSTV